MDHIFVSLGKILNIYYLSHIVDENEPSSAKTISLGSINYAYCVLVKIDKFAQINKKRRKRIKKKEKKPKEENTSVVPCKLFSYLTICPLQCGPYG